MNDSVQVVWDGDEKDDNHTNKYSEEKKHNLKTTLALQTTIEF